MRTRTKFVSASALALMLIGLGVTPAHAEGGFSSTITQGRPSFTSRTWTDKNLDALATTVNLTNCKVNYGGAAPGSTPVQSVEISLIRVGVGVVGSISKACGLYTFSRRDPADYYFAIAAINGAVPDTRIFLNANVSVAY